MRMDVKVTEQERTLLLELIENAELETIQGLDHADSRAFKGLLRTRMQLLESVRNKMQDDRTLATPSTSGLASATE